MSTARRHHWVPQFYLRNFTKNGSKHSKLFAVDLRERRAYWTSPTQVCARKDFNRVELEGQPPDALESAMSKFEGAAARALQSVIKARAATAGNQEWLYVLNLMSILAVRTPRMRARMEEYISQIYKHIGEVILSTPERWEQTRRRMIASGDFPEGGKQLTYEQMRDFHHGGKYTIEFPHGYHVVREFEGQDVVLKTLVDRKWLLLVAAPDSGGFITSDDPLCLINSDGTRPSRRNPIGHGLTETTIVFPLSRDLLALGTFEGTDATRTATNDAVATLNLQTAVHCERQVFASHERFIVGRPDSGDGWVQGADILSLLRASPHNQRRRDTK